MAAHSQFGRKSTLDDIWVRHFADSLQVSQAVPEARRWLDLGSGAGFPGLVTAITFADEPGARVHLIEADQRKCAFLQPSHGKQRRRDYSLRQDRDNLTCAP